MLGIRPEQAVAKMRQKLPVRFSTAEGACMMNGVLFTLDDATGRATARRTAERHLSVSLRPLFWSSK